MPETLFLAFRVIGEAKPAGSKNAFVPTNKITHQPYRDKGGRIIVNVVDSCKKSGAWKKTVGDTAKIAMLKAGHPQPIGGPLRLVCRFYQTRPKNQFRTGKFAEVLRDDAPQFPLSKPDLTKLIRAAEDGMTNVVYSDDSIIVRQTATKEFGRLDCLDVEIWKVF